MVNLLFPETNVITENNFCNGVILVFENLRTIGYLSMDDTYFIFANNSANDDKVYFDTLYELLEFLKKEHPNCELKLFN